MSIFARVEVIFGIFGAWVFPHLACVACGIRDEEAAPEAHPVSITSLFAESSFLARLSMRGGGVNFRALLSAQWFLGHRKGGGRACVRSYRLFFAPDFPHPGCLNSCYFLRWCGGCSSSFLALSIRSTPIALSPVGWDLRSVDGHAGIGAHRDSRRLRRCGVLREGGLPRRAQISAELPGREAGSN